MINNPDWLKAEIKPYFHQISLECIEEIDCDTCLVMQEILSDEIDDEEFLEFAIENLDELFSYIINGNLNQDQNSQGYLAGEMWFGMDRTLTFNVVQTMGSGQL